MSSLSQFILTWWPYYLGASASLAALYVLAVTGRLYCAAMYFGHWLAILKEEVMRPVRIIREILSRKGRHSRYWGERDPEDIF